MKNKFFLLFQVLIICNGYIFTNALVGPNIQNATLREYPAVVALAELDPNLTIEENVFCTGVFITKSHILTYEQCFEHIGDRYYRIIAENHNLLHGIQYFPWWWTTYERWSDSIAAHQTCFHDYDVAMLKIKGEASNRMVPSIITSITPLSRLSGRQVQVVGFGRTSTSLRAQILQTANVFVLSNEECGVHMSQATGKSLRISKRYICTTANPHVLLTEVDSGGALYYQGVLIAINGRTTSFGLPKDDPRRLNQHLDLEWYRQFINNHLRY